MAKNHFTAVLAYGEEDDPNRAARIVDASAYKDVVAFVEFDLDDKSETLDLTLELFSRDIHGYPARELIKVPLSFEVSRGRRLKLAQR